MKVKNYKMFKVFPRQIFLRKLTNIDHILDPMTVFKELCVRNFEFKIME